MRPHRARYKVAWLASSDVGGAQEPLQGGGEDLVHEGDGLPALPEDVLAAPERPRVAKAPAA